jgi:hypothetical protein
MGSAYEYPGAQHASVRDDGTVDDEAYARELLAILTNREPTGIDPADPYGQADDGIDRYDGFGRDVWVESVNVVPGEHGAEVEVGYTFEGAGTHAHGTTRLAVDAEWRHLSGYDDPAAYAPQVAGAVESAARSDFERARENGDEARLVTSLPDRPTQWRLLLDALADEGEVRTVGPGRLEVAITTDAESSPQLVTVVVTADEWEEVLLDDGALHDLSLYFADLIGPIDEDETYIVFYKGGLHRSTREKRPPVSGTAMARRLA